MNENAVVEYQQHRLIPTSETKEIMDSVAYSFWKGGMFPNCKNAEAIMCVIQLGKEIGINPMQALQGINVIKGKPSIAADMMKSLFLQRGGTTKIKTKTKEKCIIEFKKGKESHTETFTMQRAKEYGLLEKGKKDWASWWDKDSELMLYKRCIAAGIRVVDPGAQFGMYSFEEMDDFEEPAIGPNQAKNVTPESDNEAEFMKLIDEKYDEVNVILAGKGMVPFDNHPHYRNAVKKMLRGKNETLNITASFVRNLKKESKVLDGMRKIDELPEAFVDARKKEQDAIEVVVDERVGDEVRDIGKDVLDSAFG